MGEGHLWPEWMMKTTGGLNPDPVPQRRRWQEGAALQHQGVPVQRGHGCAGRPHHPCCLPGDLWPPRQQRPSQQRPARPGALLGRPAPRSVLHQVRRSSESSQCLKMCFNLLFIIVLKVRILWDLPGQRWLLRPAGSERWTTRPPCSAARLCDREFLSRDPGDASQEEGQESGVL